MKHYGQAGQVYRGLPAVSAASQRHYLRLTGHGGRGRGRGELPEVEDPGESGAGPHAAIPPGQGRPGQQTVRHGNKVGNVEWIG